MFWLLLLASIKLLNFCCCDAGNPCPSELELSPCTCSHKPSSEDVTTPLSDKLKREPRAVHVNHTEYYSVVECIAPKSINHLEEKISTALYRKWIDKLIISNLPGNSRNSLVRLPGDWLNHTRIRQLEIRNTKLSGDFISYKNSLRDQGESLHWLKISDSLHGPLTGSTQGMIQTSGFNTLKRLQGIDFSSNHITAISYSAFQYPPLNLSTLIFTKNSIQHIDNKAFKEIHLLKHLDLSHNVLTTVSRYYFRDTAQHLEHINMSFNHIRILPRDIFTNMPALECLDVSNNFLFLISEHPWSHVWTQASVTFIDVSGNYIECDCQLAWLPQFLQQAKYKKTVKGQCMQISPSNLSQVTARELGFLNADHITC